MRTLTTAIVIGMFIPLFATAANYTLLEPIPGLLPNQIIGDDLNAYLLGMFRLVIGVAGVLSVIMITWCGFNLLLSGSPSAREEAKRCIRGTLLGLLLALSSYFVINSIEAGFGPGGGVGGPFAIPSIVQGGGGAGGPPVGNPGTPVCIAVSANLVLTEGQITNISAQCAPAATAYTWSVSPGAPVVNGIGGAVAFPTAGVYSYTVIGQNAVGTGPMSNVLFITVARQAPLSCPQDMPEALVGPIGCAQINTALDWSVLGTGAQEAPIVMNTGESASIFFTTVGAGAYGTFSTRGIVDPDTFVPTNVNAMKFVNISEAQCDFRYGNIDTNECAMSGTDVLLNFQVGMGTPPIGSGGCVLAPNTPYYINVRNEEAAGTNASRSFDTCPTRRICEFIGRLTQSAAAQFNPPQVIQCSLPPPPVAPPPTFNILSPVNGARLPTGNLQVQYNASDAQMLDSVLFTITDSQTGQIIFTHSACTSGGTGTTIDPVTGNVTIVNVPPCGQQRAENILLRLDRVAGDYRLEGRACNAIGQCVRRNVDFTIVPQCVNSARLGCFVLPQLPAPQAGVAMCVPQNGTTNVLSSTNTNAHRFQLPPNTRAQIIVANQPVYGECQGFFPDPQFGFPVWQAFSWRPDPLVTPWCTIDGLLGDSWPVQAGGGCFYGRNDIRRGDQSLRIGISSSPGDVSASNQTTRDLGGNAEGFCGTSEQMAVGRVELIATTIIPPLPGECLIDPNRDYFVNVASIYNAMPVRSGWANDVYSIVFGILP